MPKKQDPFVLRADTTNHNLDVRHVAAGPEKNQILSASRDKTARCFRFDSDEADAFHDVLQPVGKPLEGHTAFVNFVLYHPSVPFLDGEAAIVTGSNDKYVILWSVDKGSMEAILGGHSDTVKCGTVLYPSMDIVTGSWDKTAVVWDIRTGEIKQHFGAHQQGVLAVTQVGARDSESNQLVVTASGDRTLMAWDTSSGETKTIFKAHTDAVQTVVAIGDSGRFASGSNDCRIALWHVASPTPLIVLQAHESFIFGLCYLPATSELVSVADDRTIKIWAITEEAGQADLQCVQVINQPCTIWSVCTVADDAIGDYLEGFATGTADSTMRLWTRNMDLVAGPEKISHLEALVSSQKIDVKALLAAGHKVGPDVISPLSASADIQGAYEGERRLFKDESEAVDLYTWSTNTWEKIGSVVMGDDQQVFKGVIPKQKLFYNGKEWDYVFDIDFGGGKAAKLPYNSGESVFDAAQRFITDNAAIGARQDHKEALQNHILQGLSEEDLAKIGVANMSSGGSGGTNAVSEYAKEAAEMARRGIQETPSWGQAKKAIEAKGGEIAFSTFAQEEAEAQAAARGAGAGAKPGMTASASALSVSTVELFAPYDAAAVKKKTSELTGGTSQFDEVINLAVAAVTSKGSDLQVLANAAAGVSQMFTTLSQGSRFPAIDTLRYIASTPAGAAYISSTDSACSELVESTLLAEKALDGLPSDAEKLVTLRLFANIAAHQGAATIQFLTKALEAIARPLAKKSTLNANQKGALQAFLQNITVGLPKLATTGGQADGLAAFYRSYFAAISEAILFEKETSIQAKYLAFANTAASSPTATPALKEGASKALLRFCKGSVKNVDRQLAAVASDLFKIIKPAEDDLE